MLEDEHDRPDEPAPSESEKHGLLERVKEWLGKPPSRDPAELAAARVEPLTVLDIGDFELLLGLVAEGHHLPDMLGQKAAGLYRRLEIARWMHEELHLPVPLSQRPPILEARWEAQGQMMPVPRV